MMLDKFRRFGATKAAKGLLFLLIIAFGAWGIEGFLQAQRGSNGLDVNGEGITLVKLEEEYKNRQSEFERMLGEPATPEQLQGLGLAPQVLNEAFARAVLRQQAEQLYLVPATRALQEAIAALPPFLNERGQFDTNRYRAGLAQLGRTPAQFEAEMATDLAVRNLGSLLQLAPLPVAIATPQTQLAEATTQVAVATVQSSPVTTTPSAEDLQKFYELNPKTYETPEVRNGTMLELSAQSLSATITIPAERIEAEYKANTAAYTDPELRVVRHILLPSLASATALQATIKTQEDFAKAANTYSTDPGNQNSKGGTLGAIKRADVVPTFGDMAFTLAAKTLSAPVQSPFGWHLIWVDEIRPARTRTLAEVRAEIEKGLRDAETQEALNQLATRADEAIAGGATLAETAKQLGLATRSLPRVKATEEALDPTLQAALFATAQGQVSPPISLPDGGLAYVETTKIEPASVPPLASIQARVVADWRTLQAELAAQRAAESLLSAARAPASGQRTLADAAAQTKVNASLSTLTFKGPTEAPKWLQPRLLEIAAAAPGTTLANVVRNGDNWHIVQVQSRTPAPAATAAAAQTAANGLSADLRNDLESLLVAYLQTTATLRCHPAGLKQVFGYDVPCADQN